MSSSNVTLFATFGPFYRRDSNAQSITSFITVCVVCESFYGVIISLLLVSLLVDEEIEHCDKDHWDQAHYQEVPNL